MHNMVGNDWEAKLEGGWEPRAWRHLCISVNSKTQRLIGVNQFGAVVNKTNTFLKDMISNYMRLLLQPSALWQSQSQGREKCAVEEFLWKTDVHEHLRTGHEQ